MGTTSQGHALGPDAGLGIHGAIGVSGSGDPALRWYGGPPNGHRRRLLPLVLDGNASTTTLRPNETVLAELYGDLASIPSSISVGRSRLRSMAYTSTPMRTASTTSARRFRHARAGSILQCADEGIRRDPGTKDITLTDVLIVGMGTPASIGPMDGVEDLQRYRALLYNGYTGDNYDDGTHSQSGGTVARNNFTAESNGCESTTRAHPIAIPISYCSDDSSSGNGDGTATPSVSTTPS